MVPLIPGVMPGRPFGGICLLGEELLQGQRILIFDRFPLFFAFLFPSEIDQTALFISVLVVLVGGNRRFGGLRLAKFWPIFGRLFRFKGILALA